MITLKIPYSTSQEAKDEIKMLQKAQATVYHCAYNLNKEGLRQKEIREELSSYNFAPEMDSWFVQSAIYRAMGQVKADKELGVVKRIFGGKKLFQRRAKGLVSKEEFQDLKLENIYLVGEAPHKGNRKFSFASDCIIFKPNAKTKLVLDLPELRGSYLKHYNNMLEGSTLKNTPITVTLDQSFIYLTYDESKFKSEKVKAPIKGRHLGIDLNPNYIGVSYFNEYKELVDTKLFNFTKLTGKAYNADKLKHELREVAISIGKLAQHYRIDNLFVEDLSFKQGDSGKGKGFNRLTKNQFLINEFNRMLSKYGKLTKVNAAYSSTIGNILHSEYPDPVAASMEIARRGIESRIVKGSKMFYPALICKETLSNRWKEATEWAYGSWVELHAILKETGLKYRVEIPSVSMFRPFESKSSKVLVY